jgi:hypothetical protein
LLVIGRKETQRLDHRVDTGRLDKAAGDEFGRLLVANKARLIAVAFRRSRNSDR